MEKFGKTVRELRESMAMTREELCGDETELSIRQLSRIELGHSAPNLTKAQFIADKLGVSLGQLTDEHLDLPKRYKELKYLILRTPTYQDKERLVVQDVYFEEIYNEFYDDLSENEQIAIECMRSRTEIFLTDKIEVGARLLRQYFHQVKEKMIYTINDLILIDLYMICLVSSSYDASPFDRETFEKLMINLRRQEKQISLEDIFILNNLLFYAISMLSDLKMWEDVEATISVLKMIMAKTHDYHKKPILSMMEWKYQLDCFGDVERARVCYEESLLFSKLIGDSYLVDKLTEEWEKDCQ